MQKAGMSALASARGLHIVPAESTSFVGGRHELVEVKRRLGTSRLVTVRRVSGTATH